MDQARIEQLVAEERYGLWAWAQHAAVQIARWRRISWTPSLVDEAALRSLDGRALQGLDLSKLTAADFV